MKFSVFEICNYRNTREQSYKFQNPTKVYENAETIPIDIIIANDYFKNHFLVVL